MIVLTHFKGHAMGGYGGSMKNIAIGCADGKIGKAWYTAFTESRCRKTGTHGLPKKC